MDANPASNQLFRSYERRRIYSRIDAQQGIHMRQLHRDLRIPLSTLEYHLYWMERRSLVVTRRLGRYKAYFTENGLDRRDRDYVYFLRQEMPRRLLTLIYREPNISFQAMVRQMPISAPTLTFHLKKLVDHHMVHGIPNGRQKCYILGNPARVQRLLRMVLEAIDSESLLTSRTNGHPASERSMGTAHNSSPSSGVSETPGVEGAF